MVGGNSGEKLGVFVFHDWNFCSNELVDMYSAQRERERVCVCSVEIAGVNMLGASYMNGGH